MNAQKQAGQIRLRYDSIRNISSPEDRDQNRKVYSGHISTQEILGLPTDENVRDYLVEAEGKQKRVLSQVHRAILNTLRNSPSDFCVLNGGFVIVARDCDVDDTNKVLTLTRPSIVNGSQTQGVLRDFYKENPPSTDTPPIHATFELIVTQDDNLIAEVSIARNYQNEVMTISIAGRLGQLDELQQAMKDANYGDLRKKETQYAGDFIDTEKLIQVLTAITPDELMPERLEKAYAYNRKTKCLKDFQKTFIEARDPGSANYPAAKALYDFYLQIAPEAWGLYQKWIRHQGFKGTRLRAIERAGGQIVEVPDGIVFPIIAAMSEFCQNKGGRWTITTPPKFTDAEMIQAAATAYQDIADSKPHLMGKTKGCYTNLRTITQIYKKLAA